MNNTLIKLSAWILLLTSITSLTASHRDVSGSRPRNYYQEALPELFPQYYIRQNPQVAAQQPGAQPQPAPHANNPIALQELLNRDTLVSLPHLPGHDFFNLRLDIIPENIKPFIDTFNKKMALHLLKAHVEFKNGADFNALLAQQYAQQQIQSPLAHNEQVAIITIHLCGHPVHKIVMKSSDSENRLQSRALETQFKRRFEFIENKARAVRQNLLPHILRKAQKTLEGKLGFEVIPSMTYTLCHYIGEDLMAELKDNISGAFNRKNIEAIKEKVGTPDNKTIISEINNFKTNKNINDMAKVIGSLDTKHPMTAKLEAALCNRFETNITTKE